MRPDHREREMTQRYMHVIISLFDDTLRVKEIAISMRIGKGKREAIALNVCIKYCLARSPFVILQQYTLFAKTAEKCSAVRAAKIAIAHIQMLILSLSLSLCLVIFPRISLAPAI